ncbi:histone-lysine N-methyltransferase SMYD3-like isoform X2 [Salvia splendens]|uniref:histone-lysine N-methyltransferase SMYD3-like isoform X2 n=1 Tax=Salvia splendens TaxID=180675 RepID=UPI001C2612C4|nr:histone-lysine N-methyltransferase SMYD3-like isoform X2 [Salvia splendens]
MEKLKSVIPETLKHKISHSTAADLDSTCSSLLDFFTNLPLFHQLVRDLTDPLVALCGKNKEAALEAKAKGNQCFTDGDYSNALQFYSQALRSAPMDAEDNERNLVATLYLNRASSLHKLGLFLESLQDCNRGLILSPVYAKVMILGSDTSYLYFCFCPCTASTWFRRAKANSSLGYYEDAINDFGVSMEIETSLSGKRQIENELNQLVDQSRLRTSAIEKQHDCSADEPLQVELQCVSTPNKGRGMISLTNIPMASLIHKEDPHGAIILKHCRETHCAFCFKELQADTVPCVSCSIPLYCSLKCQVQAGGEDFLKYKAKYRFKLDLSDDLERHIRNVTSPSFSSPDVKHFAEHRHECQGMHWPAVLPSDVVLAGRVIVKHIEEQAYGGLDHNVHKILNYGQLSSDTKLEFHVYSIILLCCLQRFYATKLPLNSTKTSEIIMLLSKIRINSMAVVRMKYSDVKQPLNYDLTSSVEQIEVAQAVYSGGSLFNHSCEPNIHAYFLSRTLFMRATENVTAGSEMELSYGPQVGQWDCGKRRMFLKDRYSFICKCSSCAQANLSDLFHGGYRCIKPNCYGVVLDSGVIKYEKEKIGHCERLSCLQDHVPSDDSISKLAHYMYEQTDYHWLEPGSCLGCATFCDLQASKKSISKAEVHIQRMKDAVTSGALTTNLLMNALRYVDILRAKLHPFNRRLAEVEDNIAQAFCLIGDLQAGMDHCRASFEILEKLYGESHIAIGNELIKLASIQFSMGQEISSDYTTRIVAIFSRYYGSHAEIMFPYVRYLKKESCRVV